VLKDLAGSKVSSQRFVGKITILNFWTTWCKFCQVEIPYLNELYKTYKDRGVEIIGVSFDYGGAKDVIPFIKKVSIDYPILIGDMNLANNFGGIMGFPTTIVIDRNWRIYQRHPGLISKATLEQDINQLLARD
jgi:thiol-disulfide isomerase/thioredoxin